MNQKDMKVKCDECNNEFNLKAMEIHESLVQLKGAFVNLVYFACPKCGKVYRISIQDRRYYDLKKDLEKAEERVRRGRCKVNAELMRMLISMVAQKEDRLKEHVDKVNKAFPGTFVFVSEGDQKTIKYLP